MHLRWRLAARPAAAAACSMACCLAALAAAAMAARPATPCARDGAQSLAAFPSCSPTLPAQNRPAGYFHAVLCMRSAFRHQPRHRNDPAGGLRLIVIDTIQGWVQLQGWFFGSDLLGRVACMIAARPVRCPLVACFGRYLRTQVARLSSGAGYQVKRRVKPYHASVQGPSKSEQKKHSGALACIRCSVPILSSRLLLLSSKNNNEQS